MTHKSTWKKGEQRVGRHFGSKRTPLSGGNSGITASDTLHDRLFIEVKLRAKHYAVQLWNKVAKKAVREKKTPVVVLQEKGRKGFWLVVHSSDLEKVAYEAGKARKNADR